MNFAFYVVSLFLVIFLNFMQYIDYIVQHYGWQGTALAATILVLFFVQLYYHIVI